MPLFQPVLCDKIACLGKSQARILESWGNLGKCELIGCPRLDNLLGAKPRARQRDCPWNVLIITARTPYFTDQQRRLCLKGLGDLKNWLERNKEKNGRLITPVWRLTGGLYQELGLGEKAEAASAGELAELLREADAVIATPSTAMLEAMMQGLPVALLDYNNLPHYVPAAWQITAREHLDAVMEELMAPPRAKMLLQDTILHDSLECRSPATGRLAYLINEMAAIGRRARSEGKEPLFPGRIVNDPWEGHHPPEPRFDLKALYPDHPVFSRMDLIELQAELGHLRRALDLFARGRQ
jgi:hypothetical protein